MLSTEVAVVATRELDGADAASPTCALVNADRGTDEAPKQVLDWGSRCSAEVMEGAVPCTEFSRACA